MKNVKAKISNILNKDVTNFLNKYKIPIVSIGWKYT